MRLQDDHTYADGWGNKRTIMGTTKDHPEWCWSLCGFWYERATGRHIGYDKDIGSYVREPSSDDLKREVFQ